MIGYRKYIINRLNQEGIHADSRFLGVIYGTGHGAHELYKSLVDMGLDDKIIAFIDRDVKKDELYNKPIVKIETLPENVNYIFVGAQYSHDIVEKRINEFLGEIKRQDIGIINVFKPYNSEEEKYEYIAFLEKKILRESYNYVPFREDGYCFSESDSKVIAWYLPQYYPMDINNEFHGLGFTEWTNVSQAYPQFVGHYQPHIPYDVGFYDLRDKNTLKRQAFLAKHYGVYGFCIHYYWFDGKKLLDEPLKVILDNPDIDINFCLNWATEDWTMEWDDGFELLGFKKTILKQNLPEDPEKFMRDVLPYMKDSRYIKINGKPVLSVYKCDIFQRDDFYKTMESFREIAKREGFPDLYIMISSGSGFDENCILWNADALVEYQPNLMNAMGTIKEVYPEGYLNPNYKCVFFDISDYLKNKSYLIKHNSDEFYRCAVTSWDNTARKGKSGGVMYTGITPSVMKTWLIELMRESKGLHKKNNDFVFLSSWNEWAEGSHLEPDMEYGYAWLDAVYEALETVKKG